MAAVMPLLQDNPAFDGMAAEDAVDTWVNGGAGPAGTGVTSGCLVTQDTGSDMKVSISAGTVSVLGQPYAFAGTGATPLVIQPAGAGDRRDTIVLRLSAGAVTAFAIQGTVPSGLTGAWTRNISPSTALPPQKGPLNWNPTPISTSVNVATDVVLAEVYVAYNTTVITGTTTTIVAPSTGNIVDKTTPPTSTLTAQFTSEQQDVTARAGSIGAANIITGRQFQGTVASSGFAGSPSLSQMCTGLTPSSVVQSSTIITVTVTGTYTWTAGQQVILSGLSGGTGGGFSQFNGVAQTIITGGTTTFTFAAGTATGTATLTSANVKVLLVANAAVGSNGTAGPYYGGVTQITLGTNGGNAVMSYTSMTAGVYFGLAIVTNPPFFGSAALVSPGFTFFGPPNVTPDVQLGASIMLGYGGSLGVTDWGTRLCTTENTLAGLVPQTKAWQTASSWSSLGVGAASPIGCPTPYAFTTQVASITGTTNSGGNVIFTAANTFAAGAQVNFTGLPSPYTALNTGTYTVIATGLSSSQFEITNAATGTAGPGGTAAQAPTLSPFSWSISSTQQIGNTSSCRRVIVFFQKQSSGDNITIATTGIVKTSPTISTSGSGIGCWDSGDVGYFGGITGWTVTNSVGGGAGSVIIGALQMQSAGVNGSLNFQLAAGGTQTADWASSITTSSFKAFLAFLVQMGFTPRRVFTGDMAGNDMLQSSTGGNNPGNTAAIAQANLITIYAAVASVTPLSELVTMAPYNIGIGSLPGVGATAWANTWVPALRNAALAASATFVDAYARFGDCSYLGDPYGLTIDNGLHFGVSPITNAIYPGGNLSRGGFDGQQALAEMYFEKLQYSKNIALTGTVSTGTAADGKIVTGLAQGGSGWTSTGWYANANDANPVVQVGNAQGFLLPGIFAGPGGSTVPDTALERTGVGAWTSTGTIAATKGTLAAQVPILSQLAENQQPFIVSGCVWTADSPASTLNGSMTAGTIMIKGILLTVGAITAHAFAASSDTYIDFTDGGAGAATVTFTAVGNNTMSPALAANGLRNAVVISTGSALTSTAASICQGGFSFNTATALGASTVAAGSNGSNITATPLNVAAGANFASGGGWVQVAHSGGQTYTIKYTSVSSNTLVGVTVISGSGTVSTGDTVQQVTPINACDMLGNPIAPTKPYPTVIGQAQFANALTTTLTSQTPVFGNGTNSFIAPFIVPAGPPLRTVKITALSPYFGSTAAAGTTLTAIIYVGNPVSGGTIVATQGGKVAVTGDGNPLLIVGYATLAPGSYTAQMSIQQGAAGTLSFGSLFFNNQMTVELA